MRRTIFVAPVLTLTLVVGLAGPAAAAPKGSLAVTGPATGNRELGLGLPLLLAGLVAVWWGRYRPRHARAS